MQEAIKTARAIAGGDLSGKIVTSRHDDIGQMLRAMQQMNLYLAAMIGDVRSNMDTWRQRRRTYGNTIGDGSTKIAARPPRRRGDSASKLKWGLLMEAALRQGLVHLIYFTPSLGS
ncbi:hypothetical protein [Pseudoduganella sp. RAF53_2]|uniref:hypothetical protein n=1 Tax=unclassified Pseudoduganella TaxID=2637179 RepID=UPI003F9CB0B7